MVSILYQHAIFRILSSSSITIFSFRFSQGFSQEGFDVYAKLLKLLSARDGPAGTSLEVIPKSLLSNQTSFAKSFLRFCFLIT